MFLVMALAGCRESATRVTTFHRDVAPILHSRCASCHHTGGSAPFSLLTYDDARNRASQIAEVTESRFMPPWLPESGHEAYLGNRSLADEEITTLARWQREGAVEGDPAEAVALPKFGDEWQLGKPDLILESPEFHLPAEGKDRFRNFILPVTIGGDRWVRVVEIRPSVPQRTHHARLGIDSNGESVRRDAADIEPGYEGMAWGEDPPGQLVTWTPGMQVHEGTAGTAWRLTPDMNLVLHTHLQPSGKPEPLKFRVEFYFAEGDPTIQPQILRIGSRDIDIPAGASEFVATDEYELPITVDATFIFPHAHSLCRQILVTANLPDGTQRTLIAIKRFDENWHDAYRFVEPVRLPRRTRLATRFVYDNSTANIRNPHYPPQRVVYGSNADDEMADVYLQVIAVEPDQSAVLAEHYGEYELNSKIVGYRRSLELHPDDSWSREALASCYLAQGKPALATEILNERPELLAESLQAHVILAMAKLAGGDSLAAVDDFYAILQTDDQMAATWVGFGQVLMKAEKIAAAEDAFRTALEIAPRLTIARLDLVDLLIAQEKFDEAIAECQLAIQYDDTSHQSHLKLADIYARQRRYDESLEQFAMARKLAPYVYSPEASLAVACYQNGDEEKANKLLSSALKANPRDPVPHCFAGQIARRNRDWPAAGDHFEQARHLPIPATWPASHVRQFLTLIYTEQLQLAQETEDIELLRSTASAWLKLEPKNGAIRKLLDQIAK